MIFRHTCRSDFTTIWLSRQSSQKNRWFPVCQRCGEDVVCGSMGRSPWNIQICGWVMYSHVVMSLGTLKRSGGLRLKMLDSCFEFKLPVDWWLVGRLLLANAFFELSESHRKIPNNQPGQPGLDGMSLRISLPPLKCFLNKMVAACWDRSPWDLYIFVTFLDHNEDFDGYHGEISQFNNFGVQL